MTRGIPIFSEKNPNRLSTMAYSIEQRDEQLLNTTAKIRYRLTFPHAAQHLVHVEMVVETDAEQLDLGMASWLPGSYKVRDFISNQGNPIVVNDAGESLPFEWTAKNRLSVATGGSGTISLTYTYFGHERTVRHSHIDRFHAFLNPGNCLMYVDGRRDEIHHVEIEHSWSTVSTALSPVRDNVWGALNYDILVDSPIEIGDHYVATYEVQGAKHEVAITGTGNFDPEWITERTRTIIDKAIDMWGSLPYDRYVWILHMVTNQYGGLEHSRSQVSMFDTNLYGDKKMTVKFLTLLAHEFFHTWNVKRIRPIELGPFNYDEENYTRMLWLAEGVTSYYDDLMSYRCGFHSRKDYLRTLSESHLTALSDVPGRLSTSIKDSSYLAWVKLYNPTPDSHNRFPSYYLKGGVIFLLLDMLIIGRSGGEHSLDDGMRALYARYEADPSTGVTEEEFVSIVSDATGVDIADTFLGWLNDAAELPLEEALAPLGLAWTAKVEKRDKIGEDIEFPASGETWAGVAVNGDNGKLMISRVWDDSPAQRAGIGSGDEVIALNGQRVSDPKGWKAFISRATPGTQLSFVGACEGTLYETTMTLEDKTVYHLTELDDKTPEQERCLEKWLARTSEVPA